MRERLLCRFIVANIGGRCGKTVMRLLNYINTRLWADEYTKLLFKQNNLSNRLRNKWI